MLSVINPRVCQACKSRMPFSLDDGTPYFEKVEFLPELTRRHYQNYLALCPNHGAMFQHANGSRDTLDSPFLTMVGNELKVILAQEETCIYFTKTHVADLQAVVNVDREEAEAALVAGRVNEDELRWPRNEEAAARAPKKISSTGITGQKGVNPIEGVIHDMESR